MSMIERGNIPTFVTLGLILAAGGVAKVHPKNNDRSFLPHKPIPEQGGLIKYEGVDAQAIYFEDGTRDLREFDRKGNVVRVYHEKCKHIFLGGRFLQIATEAAQAPHPASEKDFELYEEIIEPSTLCNDDGYITPSDFHGKEAAVDELG
jgi:hypothetical protein